MRHVERLLAEVFRSVDESRAELAARHAGARSERRRLRRGDLEGIRSLAHAHLSRHATLVVGTGVACAPDLLEDAPRWLEWWLRAPDGQPRFLSVNLDPDDPEYYAYEEAAWFDGQDGSRSRSVVGPYVDYSGTDDHLVTLTMGVFDGDAFLGVAGADIRVGRLEAALEPLLGGGAGDLVLVNESGRVIVSTSARYLPGSLLDRAELDRIADAGRVERPDGVRVARSDELPWAIVEYPPSDR